MRIDMISDSVQLWGAISRIASFEDSDYDLELKESIKLGITENSRKELSRIQSLRIESEYLSRRVLAETDGGTGVIVHAVAELVREILNMPYNRRCGFVDDAINRIETYLSNCPKEMMKIEKQIEEIITILNMPFWKKRHYNSIIPLNAIRNTPIFGIHTISSN